MVNSVLYAIASNAQCGVAGAAIFGETKEDFTALNRFCDLGRNLTARADDG
jgi:hypothetical protein